jgi:hypothetical protein
VPRQSSWSRFSFRGDGLFPSNRFNFIGGLPNFGRPPIRQDDDPVADQDTKSLEFQCLCALRDAREWFLNEIIQRARTHDECKAKRELSEADHAALCSNEAFQIAEFYYLVRENKMADRKTIRSFLARHNDDIRELTSNKEKRDALGLTESRLKGGLFSEPQIEKVVQNVSENKLVLDQSDLGRLLCQLFADETTRKAVVALGRGGWLTRIHTGRQLVVSSGLLEACFEKHLHMIVSSLRPTIQNTEGSS